MSPWYIIGIMKPEIRNKLWSLCKKTPVHSPLVICPGDQPELLPLTSYWNREFSETFLELGSGWGEVILELAKNQPQCGYLALERKWNRLAQTDSQARDLGLDNLIFSGVNFQWFLQDIFAAESFDTILLNFPDPWPKKKHHKNRAITADFLTGIHRILKPGGRFLFATDHGGYARSSIRVFRTTPWLTWRDREWSFDRWELPVSQFEQEKQEEGKCIYYFERFKS